MELAGIYPVSKNGELEDYSELLPVDNLGVEIFTYSAVLYNQ